MSNPLGNMPYGALPGNLWNAYGKSKKLSDFENNLFLDNNAIIQFSGQKQRRTSDRFEPYSPKPRDLQNLDTPLHALSQLTNNLNRTASSLRKSSDSAEVKTVSQFISFLPFSIFPLICKQRHHLSALLTNQNRVKQALSNRRCCTVPEQFNSVQVHKR